MAQLVLLSLADIFSIYPETLNAILRAEEEKRSLEGALAKDFLHLPSDADWQEKVYYRLLEVQKRVNQAIESGLALEDVDKKKEKPVWSPADVLQNLSSARSSPGEVGKKESRKCVADHPIEFVDINLLGVWSLEIICKAGKLLKKPPIRVMFDNEHEMRKAYSLIYDVFRYKHVLIQALNDVSFYAHFAQLRNDENRVWLMLFELYSRHFLKRPAEEIDKETEMYKEAQLDYIAKCLWNLRVRLAAAISRLRIKNGALHLSQLLPMHLQDEKVAIAAANPIVSGWINPFKIKDKGLAVEQLNSMGFTEVVDDENLEQPLKVNQYKWDKVCPLFMSCLPSDRSEFARSELVKTNSFIMQDRTFSLGPAIISKLLDHFELDGDVVQTHVSSPRSTAYLAALFFSINRVNDFLAFGAGPNLPQYKEYIEQLGIDNIRLYAENFHSLPLKSPLLETVVGIFATPPNSYSGIADPIDLICSRGGDLSMLEVLTESEVSNEGKNRVMHILEEQRETLRLAMSRPQVQFVLYETHSIVGSENQDMVERAVEDVNRCSFEKHLAAYKEKKRLEEIALAELASIPSAALAQSPAKKRGGASSAAKSEDSSTKVRLARDAGGGSKDSISCNLTGSTEDLADQVKVPKTDEFEVSQVPDMCLNQDMCLNLNAMGCYVSLLRRKQVTRLDAKYLIKMAEARGLFGNADRKKSAKPKSSKKVEKKSDKNGDGNGMRKTRLKKEDVASLIERLNQPTHSSLVRSNVTSFSSVSTKSIKFNMIDKACLRHSKHHGDDYALQSAQGLMSAIHLDSRAKIWWRETTEYVKRLRKAQSRKSGDKAEEGKMSPLILSRAHAGKETFKIIQATKSRSSIRVPFPVTVNQLEFRGSPKFEKNKRLPDESGYWTV